MKVFLHTRSPGKLWANNQPREFGRLPVVGEFVALDSDSPWYRVQAVIHCPFEAEYEAEIYAVEIEAEDRYRALGDEG